MTQVPRKSPEPVRTGVDIAVTSGGTVQLVKFNLQNEYGLSYSENYTIPESWTDEQFHDWRDRKIAEITEKVEEFAQAEQDALLEAADWYRSSIETGY